LEGATAAAPTYIGLSGAPQCEPFLEYYYWALENGCGGLNILGSTGEANSLAHEDRRKVMQRAAESLDKSKLMVGTATPSLNETIGLTLHAAQLSFSVALILPPYFYKPATSAGLIEWYSALDEALTGLPIELYFYNFPQMTGINIPVEVIVALAERFPNRFTGIKARPMTSTTASKCWRPCRA